MPTQAGAWSEVALVTITRYVAAGGTDYEFAAIVEKPDIDIGDKDVESIPTIGGGRITKNKPQEDTTITLELYPLGNDPATSTGLSQYHSGTIDATTPMLSAFSRTRDLFRVAIMWTEDTTATSAGSAVAVNKYGYRFVVAHAYLTSYKLTWEDGVLKATAQFKCPPFNKSGIALIRDEYCSASSATGGQIAALSTYNSTNYTLDSTTNFTW